MSHKQFPVSFVPAVQFPKRLTQPLHIAVDHHQCVWVEKELLENQSKPLTHANIAPYFQRSPEDHHLNCERQYYLGKLGKRDCVAWHIAEGTKAPDGYESVHLYHLLLLLDQSVFTLIGRASQIVVWGQNHRYCGACGGTTKIQNTQEDRMLVCTNCGLEFYPRISPCVIVVVRKGEELLLANHINHPQNMYSALAGFVEAGESLEDCVAREIEEEVAIRVRNPRYVGSQQWPFPHQLMLGFFADYLEGTIQPNPTEILDAAWWHYTKLPETLPGGYSIAGQLIATAVSELKLSA